MPCGLPGTRRAASSSLLGLAPGGVCLAGVSPRRRCALTAPFHPCRRRRHVRLRRLGGVFLWHFPAGFPGSDLPTTLALRCPDFPRGPVVSPASRDCLASSPSMVGRAGPPDQCDMQGAQQERRHSGSKSVEPPGQLPPSANDRPVTSSLLPS